ncbi:PAS-domain containing protein [Bradyrhizobium sp. U87765 SZCCT0131]|nr:MULTISPECIES: PAS domain-containing sensor histidine kinase [unclassified Bradyrhizobium]MBR1216701.1 PAS-domain containing protein [Bradyrhizobium sp. U87765 SZCCT0131]MBR1259543.1 PAS-domain containing protein [Bradyrhizobium sp. U87765 SZCCT0134]MBR1305684.1 PAS-domain containing protein [Bradyrhizobium sp. U87765 SZCCT0110]MBR1322051.1 PAS-domain containing protein [Bradyrhizobium sp. U87765 SZCCT0109]MBR1350671.1 PAS-domain containing protein [Bradyrhizobium sp. U87765 SZCCT0048]
MAGVVRAIRRTLMSGTALVRGGLVSLAGIAAARADDGELRAVETFLNLTQQEIAALAIAAGVLGFSVLATILLMRTRLRAAHTEARLRADVRALQSETDSLRALLFTEPQVVISWPAASLRPEISGDLALLLPPAAAQQSPQRILAFGTWLPPEQALQMDHAVDALCADGASFTLHLTTSNGRTVEAIGRAIGGKAIVRIRELSGVRRELAETSLRYRDLQEETSSLRAFAAALPWPVWARRDDGTLLFANAAYAEATEATTISDAVERNLELLDSGDRQAMARALADRAHFEARLPVVIGGQRRIFDVRALKVTGGSAGVAVDASEASSLSEALKRMAEAHRRTLDQLSSGVAVFDGQRRLAFYNDAYRRLWNLDQAFLDSQPDDSSVLDRLRATRKIPEPPDFRQWKAKLHEAYRAVEPAKDTWYLPDGRAIGVVTTPNPEGGVTYLFDDVTESLKLARQFDGLIRVQRETLDNLVEAVAVFGSNGRAQLFNPAFARMWKLSPEAMEEHPHIETVEGWCRPLFDEAATWRTIRDAITGIDNRNPVPLKLERKDGSVLDCLAMPLPDGATMLTFQDITDTVNVERALRERNEALETADQMKVDFVHHVSYELRSPLTTIIGFAHFLSDPATGPLTVKQDEYLGYITSSTNALLAIINNILDLATIDAGAMTLNLGPVDIRSAIEAAAEGIQDRLARDHIRLQIDAAPGIGNFVADERRVVQVLYNLLANAVGFSPQDGVITISARRHSDSVSFTVSDAGPGIAPDVKDKVFDWFESHSNGSRHRGAGLGLSLVRSFVELHGGKVRVDSVVGKGTSVTCDFPIDQAAHRTAAE